jgi:(p)ppGpp synthase/HD superfamily hydrolase
MRNMLNRAIEIAALAHSGDVDKAGEPYILHVLRVVMSPVLVENIERTVAALHDVVEDCPEWTLQRLLEHECFPIRVVAAVDAMTKRLDEPYEEYIARVAQNEIARRVKLADLYDNANPARMPNPTKADESRTEKYLRAIKVLEAA